MDFTAAELPYILVFIVIGMIIGAALTKILNRGPSAVELQDQLDESRDQLAEYQQHVGAHFQKTADLVNNLTESYQQVHEHLSEGAQNLAQTHGGTLENTAFKALSDSKPKDNDAAENDMEDDNSIENEITDIESDGDADNIEYINETGDEEKPAVSK